jgi:2-dehydropantoate 2-reductase
MTAAFDRGADRRFVIFGAGAIGSVIGARLFEHGHDVVFVARGAGYEALSTKGLTLRSPEGETVLHVPVVPDLSSAGIRADDIVLLTMKGQDTAVALSALSATASASIAVICAQNGVENERMALRLFPHVYGMYVMCPATNETAGIVTAHSAPVSGILDVGRWPGGTDDLAEQVGCSLTGSSFSSKPCDDIARWKWGKLLTNLANAVEAICGVAARDGKVARLVSEEGVACLEAAGIAYAGVQEMASRRGDLLRPLVGGSSSWQSLQRRTGSIETDFLNGEIVLLGRLSGVPTPVNEAVQRCANDLARARRPPGSMTEADVLREARVTDRA